MKVYSVNFSASKPKVLTGVEIEVVNGKTALVLANQGENRLWIPAHTGGKIGIFNEMALRLSEATPPRSYPELALPVVEGDEDSGVLVAVHATDGAIIFRPFEGGYFDPQRGFFSGPTKDGRALFAVIHDGQKIVAMRKGDGDDKPAFSMISALRGEIYVGRAKGRHLAELVNPNCEKMVWLDATPYATNPLYVGKAWVNMKSEPPTLTDHAQASAVLEDVLMRTLQSVSPAKTLVVVGSYIDPLVSNIVGRVAERLDKFGESVFLTPSGGWRSEHPVDAHRTQPTSEVVEEKMVHRQPVGIVIPVITSSVLAKQVSKPAPPPAAPVVIEKPAPPPQMKAAANKTKPRPQPSQPPAQQEAPTPPPAGKLTTLTDLMASKVAKRLGIPLPDEQTTAQPKEAPVETAPPEPKSAAKPAKKATTPRPTRPKKAAKPAVIEAPSEEPETDESAAGA